jgi:UDPglucose 6-dehydrogenase
MNVSVVGLGKLGLPLLALLANSGHKVFGYDKSSGLLELLKNGDCPYPEPGLSDLLKSGSKNIQYVSTIDQVVENSEVCFVIVPTPSTPNGGFDNGVVLAVCEELGTSLRNMTKDFTVDIVSTVMPGSCDSEIRETLEKSSGIKLGQQLGLCYNPEFIALGSVIRDMQYPDMQLLGANSNKHAERVESVLHSITRKETPIRRMSLIEAELVKISVNNFVTMKIAFANMLGEIAQRIGNMDIDVITDAIGLDSRIGKKYLKAGTPFGGPCFPRDTKAC